MTTKPKYDVPAMAAAFNAAALIADRHQHAKYADEVRSLNVSVNGLTQKQFSLLEALVSEAQVGLDVYRAQRHIHLYFRHDRGSWGYKGANAARDYLRRAGYDTGINPYDCR